MPLLRLDPRPPVDLSLVDWSFKQRIAELRDVVQPALPAASTSTEASQHGHQARRPQPSPASEVKPPTAGALILAASAAQHHKAGGPSRGLADGATSTAVVAIVDAAHKSVASGALIVNSAAVMAAQKDFEVRTAILKGSTKDEVAAFTQAFNAAKPTQLFAARPSQPVEHPTLPLQPSSSPAGSGEEGPAAMKAASAPPAFEVTVEMDSARDHLGRTFMHFAAAANTVPSLKAGAVPSRLVHAYKGHTAGVQMMELIPGTAHLLLSADLGGTVMLWDLLTHKRRVAAYRGHAAGVRSITFASDGLKFSSAALDGSVLEWDTETGQVINSLRYKDAVVMSHAYRPAAPRNASNTIIAGAGRLVIQWDTRVNPTRVVREYEAHTGPVMHVGFLRGGNYFGSTSEDKTFRTWDIDSSVTVQDFADAAMHAVPHFACHPGSGVVAAQSLDNRVNFFAPLKAPGKFKILKDKFCEGHAVSGSSCRVAFSGDGQFVSSGDVHGELHVWDAVTCQPVKRFRAHAKALNCHVWHPTANLLLTAGWDGSVKAFAA